MTEVSTGDERISCATAKALGGTRSPQVNVPLLGDLIKKNKNAVLIGFLITVTLVLFDIRIWGFILSDVNPILWALANNVIGFILVWLLFTYLVAKSSAYKVLAVFSFLILVAVTQNYLKLPMNNPVSLPALVLFWFGISCLLLPDFIRRNRVVILSIFGLVLIYFYIFRKATQFRDVHIRIVGYFIVVYGYFTFVLWICQQIKWLINVKLNQTRTELALLKSRVNPHFFFNTLNNLYGLVVEKSDQAPEVVLKLSDVMRYTIYEGEKDLVPLAEEIHYLKSYIELHEIRYQKNVDIRFTDNVDGTLKVAPLLFIILLENAFKHGVERLTDGAFIHLDLQADQKEIQFRLENNYDPIDSNEKPGIGIDNLRKRLELLYPNSHQLIMKQVNGVYNVKLTIQIK